MTLQRMAFLTRYVSYLLFYPLTIKEIEAFGAVGQLVEVSPRLWHYHAVFVKETLHVVTLELNPEWVVQLGADWVLGVWSPSVPVYAEVVVK